MNTNPYAMFGGRDQAQARAMDAAYRRGERAAAEQADSADEQLGLVLDCHRALSDFLASPSTVRWDRLEVTLARYQGFSA